MAKHWMKAPNGEVFETNNPEWHSDSEKLSRAEGLKARKEYCRKELKKILKPGKRVELVLRDVSRSGMTRTISAFVVIPAKKGEPAYLRNIDNLAADLLGWTNDGGIKVSGCGMDMGFHLVYSLGAAIWPKGTPKPHGRRNGEPDSAGGYALKHNWL